MTSLSSYPIQGFKKTWPLTHDLDAEVTQIWTCLRFLADAPVVTMWKSCIPLLSSYYTDNLGVHIAHLTGWQQYPISLLLQKGEKGCASKTVFLQMLYSKCSRSIRNMVVCKISLLLIAVRRPWEWLWANFCKTKYHSLQPYLHLLGGANLPLHHSDVVCLRLMVNNRMMSELILMERY